MIYLLHKFYTTGLLYTGWAKNDCFLIVLYTKLFSFFIQSKTGVFYVAIFKYYLRNFTVTTLR